MSDNIPAIQRMQEQVQQWTQQKDRRAIFLDCYRMMTSNMLTAIEAGEFHDPVWVRALLEHFASHPFVGYAITRNLAGVIGQRLQVFQAMWLREMQRMVQQRSI